MPRSIPAGMLRTGFLTSSETLATSSSPPKATKTKAASAITSPKFAFPSRKNGVNRDGLTAGAPQTMNAPIAASRMNTMMSCAHAAAFVPIRLTSRKNTVIVMPLGMRGTPQSWWSSSAMPKMAKELLSAIAAQFSRPEMVPASGPRLRSV